MITATQAKALLEQSPVFTIEQVDETIRLAARTTTSTMFPAVRFNLSLRDHLEARGFEVEEVAGNVVVSW